MHGNTFETPMRDRLEGMNIGKSVVRGTVTSGSS